MPLRDHNLAVESPEGLEEAVVNDVALELLFYLVPRAEGMGVPKVEVDLNEGGVYLESNGAAQYHLMHPSVDAEGELVRQEELSCHDHPNYPQQELAAKSG